MQGGGAGHTGGMKSTALLDSLRRVHGDAVMHGWDFAVLDGRVNSSNPPWDFDADCLAALRTAGHALDLGTGGGERVLRLLSDLGAASRPQLAATEGWAPNVPVARRNLAAARVEVARYSAGGGDPLPFADASFDLVMSRHEMVDAAEAARVLAPGGVLLAQQVDGRDVQELRDWFGGGQAYPSARLELDRAAAEQAGLTVDLAQEWAGPMEFADAEALVTYLALVPWSVPGFRVDDHAGALMRLEQQGRLRVTQRRYRLYAYQRKD